MKPISAPGYDRFKTIIAMILAIILLIMLLRGCSTSAAAPVPTATISAPSATTIPPTALPTQTTAAESATETQTPVPASPTLESTITPTASVATETPAESTTATATPASAATEATPATTDQATPTPSQNAACNTSAPSRLSVGQKARVIQRLNMRTEASITANIIQTNPTNTQVEIIGGPVCTPVGSRAYLWWQIRLPDGSEGWSAETQLNSASYFLEPIP